MFVPEPLERRDEFRLFARGGGSLDHRRRRSTPSPRINPHEHKGRFEGDENTTQI